MSQKFYRLEALEERRLLSGGITFNATSGLLRIDGTEQADVVQVSRSGNTLHVQLNGAASTRDARAVRQIQVSARGGNDVIVIGTTVGAACTLWGGPGNDLLRGGNGADRVFGEAGNDRLAGNG